MRWRRMRAVADWLPSSLVPASNVWLVEAAKDLKPKGMPDFVTTKVRAAMGLRVQRAPGGWSGQLLRELQHALDADAYR